MKNKFLRLFFCITLMFGFAFTIASCKKQETVNPDNGKGNEEEPPKEEEPVTLTKLPDGYYTKLFQTPDSIVITFKDAEFAPVDSDKDVRYVIADESIIRIGIVDDTLKANGFLKLYETYPYGSYINEAYFSLDDSFIASSITYAEPNLSYQLPETATEDKIHYLTDISNKDIYYNEIKLSKTEITNLINSKLEELGFDFDVSSIKSLKDLTTLIGIPNETVDTTKAQIEGLYTKLMEMFFKASFKQNEITLSLTFDSLKLYNNLGKTLTIQAIVDSVLGEGKFVEILELLEDYSKVDKTKTTAPQDNQQYFTLVDGVYVPCENLTTWDQDTEYYIDNKDLGEFTLADLLKTSAEDTVGFVSVEEIDELVEKLYELIGKATPAMEESSFDIGSMLAQFDLSVYIQIFATLFGVSQYYILEPVTGLTEWEGLNEDGTGTTTYYSSIYSECGAITEFDKGTLYFTKNTNDEFVVVDTKNATPNPNTTYYYFNAVRVNHPKVLKTPDANKTYYTKTVEYEYEEIEMVVEWAANDTYYTLTYVECENLSAWAPDTDYYYFDHINDTFEWVDPEEIPTPYAGTKYYTERYDEVDKTLVPAPEQDVLYFKYYDTYEGYFPITTHFEENETYYVKDGEEYLPTTDLEPQAGVTYYTRYEENQFNPCEGLTQFEAGIEYYISEESDVYELVDTYEVAGPDPEETYYRVTNRIGKLLACEPMQKVTVNEIASKVYMILALTGKIEINYDYLSNGLKVTDLLAPYVQEFKDAKLYDLFAEIYDAVKPEYTVFEGTEWEENTSYFTYDEDDEEYQEVDLEAVTAPEADVVYYVLKDRTGAEIGAMFDDAIDALNENVSLKIVTDNDVKLQTIELKVTQAPIFGTITVDFTKLYSDQIRSTLMHDVDYASERDDESTAILESYITDGCFDGYERSGATYELVSQNGEYVGIKEIRNNQEHVYLFGTNTKDDEDYYSAKEYYAEGYIEIRATLYDASEKNFETFNWVYNLSTKKFEFSDDMRFEDLYYYDYSKKEYVTVYVQVDRTQTPEPQQNTAYFTYNEETKKYTEVQVTEFTEGTTYYKYVTVDGDYTHPFVLKIVSRFTKEAMYLMRYYPATTQAE